MTCSPIKTQYIANDTVAADCVTPLVELDGLFAEPKVSEDGCQHGIRTWQEALGRTCRGRISISFILDIDLVL